MVLSAVVNLLLAVTLSVFGYLMYPFFILVYIWIAAYVIFIATLIRRESTAEEPLIRKEIHLVGAVVLAILIRLIFIATTEHISLDALWYVDYGKFMHRGAVPYTGFYFPYPPVFAYFIYIITTIFQGVEGFRLFAIMMDAAVLVVLWKLIQQEVGAKWASTATMAYAFLPISVIESGWNGHFEPLVSLLILLAVWFSIKQKCSISGVFLGLAIATKVYPIVVVPILFVFIKGWKNRLWFILSAAFSIALTFAPLLLLLGTTNPSGVGNASGSFSAVDLLEPIFGFLFTLPFPSVIIAIGITVVIVFAVIRLMRQINKNDSSINTRIFQAITVALGLVLIAMGVMAGLYPLLPISRLVYWRFPIDIGLVRGITTICVGLLIIFNAYHDRVNGLKRQVSRNSLLALMGATSLLLMATASQVFFGWYLLWSIPFFLLLRDRRLSYVVILCLLFVYPSYTHDSFASLGFEEARQWEDEFGLVDGWSSYVNIQGDGVNTSQVSAYVETDGINGRFWFDTRDVTNDSYLSNVSFSFVKMVDFSFDETTEFVTRIISSWDPPFGRYADLSLSFGGDDANDEYINGSIISRTSMFTNLTYTPWRYAFMNVVSATHNGTITMLNLTIYPVQRVESFYQIDFFYTTFAGPLHPASFLIIPSLIAISLTAFAILCLELERERKLTSTYAKEH
jgi:hypothetical protein